MHLLKKTPIKTLATIVFSLCFFFTITFADHPKADSKYINDFANLIDDNVEKQLNKSFMILNNIVMVGVQVEMGHQKTFVNIIFGMVMTRGKKH